jgi:hypothetical protein
LAAYAALQEAALQSDRQHNTNSDAAMRQRVVAT